MGEAENKKNQLIERFDFAKKQGIDLIEEINQYAKQNDCYDRSFMQGYTFRDGLQVLEQERDLIFNAENRNSILESGNTSSELDFLIKKIEEQINHHGEMRIALNIFFKSLN